MPKTRYYEKDMVKITLRFPPEVCEWLDNQDNVSETIRDIVDRKLLINQERNVPAYKKPKRSKRGRPRNDEDPNYIPPVKRPRGRPSKSKEEKVLKETKNEIG